MKKITKHILPNRVYQFKSNESESKKNSLNKIFSSNKKGKLEIEKMRRKEIKINKIDTAKVNKVKFTGLLHKNLDKLSFSESAELVSFSLEKAGLSEKWLDNKLQESHEKGEDESNIFYELCETLIQTQSGENNSVVNTNPQKAATLVLEMLGQDISDLHIPFEDELFSYTKEDNSEHITSRDNLPKEEIKIKNKDDKSNTLTSASKKKLNVENDTVPVAKSSAGVTNKQSKEKDEKTHGSTRATNFKLKFKVGMQKANQAVHRVKQILQKAEKAQQVQETPQEAVQKAKKAQNEQMKVLRAQKEQKRAAVPKAQKQSRTISSGEYYGVGSKEELSVNFSPKLHTGISNSGQICWNSTGLQNIFSILSNNSGLSKILSETQPDQKTNEAQKSLRQLFENYQTCAKFQTTMPANDELILGVVDLLSSSTIDAEKMTNNLLDNQTANTEDFISSALKNVFGTDSCQRAIYSSNSENEYSSIIPYGSEKEETGTQTASKNSILVLDTEGINNIESQLMELPVLRDIADKKPVAFTLYNNDIKHYSCYTINWKSKTAYYLDDGSIRPLNNPEEREDLISIVADDLKKLAIKDKQVSSIIYTNVT